MSLLLPPGVTPGAPQPNPSDVAIQNDALRKRQAHDLAQQVITEGFRCLQMQMWVDHIATVAMQITDPRAYVQQIAQNVQTQLQNGYANLLAEDVPDDVAHLGPAIIAGINTVTANIINIVEPIVLEAERQIAAEQEKAEQGKTETEALPEASAEAPPEEPQNAEPPGEPSATVV